MTKLLKRTRRDERGGALLELAISLPLFVVLLALIFDVGLGFSAARDSSSAARSAARVAALAGNERFADYRALDAIRAEYAHSDDKIVWVAIYRSEPGGDGQVPAACVPGGSSVAGLCNVYTGEQIAGFTPDTFDSPTCAADPDRSWCPVDRMDNNGDYLGVGVWTTHKPTVGIINSDDYELADRAVFALFFPEAIG